MNLAHDASGNEVLTSIIDWLPGECLFGWCARHYRTHGFRADVTGLALFARTQAHQHRNLPSGLDQFVSVTKGLLGTAEELLLQRTAACSYLPFFDEQQRAYAVAAARRREGTTLLKAITRIAGNFEPLLDLRHCPDCRRADFRAHGEAVRRLEHQLPAVWYCNVHERTLVVQPNRAAGWIGPDEELGDQCTSRPLPPPANDRERQALRMCTALAAVIARCPRIDAKALAVDCIHRLAALGLTSERRLNSALLDEWFSYSPIGQWLARAQVMRAPTKGWIANLLKGTYAPTPLKWTLLWCAIWDLTPVDESVRAFEDVAKRK